MGNDGGSIPKRRELVKNAARAPTVSELKATALESLAHSWTHCALTGAPLEIDDTVVSDWRGRLYSYEAVLRGLVSSDKPGESSPASRGIRSTRDIQKIKFSRTGNQRTCPISMKEMGPTTKAVYLVPCGHVFAEVAIKEIQEEACPECGEQFRQDNVIPVLPVTETEMTRLESRIQDLRAKGLTHSLKKEKHEKRKNKRKGDELQQEGGNDTKAKDDGSQDKDRLPGGQIQNGEGRIRGINNSLAASLSARVLAEQTETSKKRRIATEAGPGSVETTRS